MAIPGTVDVIVVGAGPTGLMPANELARRGINALIIDRIEGPSERTKALGVQARTLEIYAHVGIAGYDGAHSEMCRVYVARDLEHVGGTPDETEEFEIVRWSPAEVDERIGRGVIWDGMTIAAWTIAKGRI